MDILDTVYLTGIVPFIGKVSPAEAGDLARALSMGGLPLAALHIQSEKDVSQSRVMQQAVEDFFICACGVEDEKSARLAVQAGAKLVFATGLDAQVQAVLAANEVLALPPLSRVVFDKLGQYFSSGKVAPCLCPDLQTPHRRGKSYFEIFVRRVRQAVNNMLGFDLRHIGINQPDGETSARTAGEFESLFGFARTDRGGAYFAGEVVEVMKKPFYGHNGHIAVSTNDAARAAHYLQKQGVQFNWDSAGYSEDGSLRVVYLAKELGGFAVHILQK
ncbi:hypothetical protein [Candidatus Avelusimicrobium aviculae]|uniref:hypothetical protein n=1 Tax=Candidatus Avelusimicrobium aviculae TaxID=3416206 RepID=UPI003D115501